MNESKTFFPIVIMEGSEARWIEHSSGLPIDKSFTIIHTGVLKETFEYGKKMYDLGCKVTGEFYEGPETNKGN